MPTFRDVTPVAWPVDALEDYRNSKLTKYFGVVSFTILVWDHIITFPDEVELIWKGTKGPLVYLFFLNRYLIPLSFIVNLWAYFRDSWSLESCGHFVRFEGAMTMTGVSVVALMMFLRIRALYRQQLAVQTIVIVILLTFIGVNSWLLTRGIPVRHEAYPLVDSCTMIFDPKVPGSIASGTAWLPLLYDTVVVSLTLYRTARALYDKSAGQIIRVLLQEGLLYYSAICTVTLALTIMIVSADQSVRNVTAQLELCVTVLMMSRITLHLKRFAHSTTTIQSYTAHRHVPRRIPPFTARPHVPPRRIRGRPSLETLPRIPFPLGWFTHTPVPSNTVPGGESFALEPFPSTAPPPQASSGLIADVTDGPAPPFTVDMDGLYSLGTVGDEELAGRRSGT